MKKKETQEDPKKDQQDQQAQENPQVLTIAEIDPQQQVGMKLDMKTHTEQKNQEKIELKAHLADPNLIRQMEDLKLQLQTKDKEIQKFHKTIKRQNKEREQQ